MLKCTRPHIHTRHGTAASVGIRRDLFALCALALAVVAATNAAAQSVAGRNAELRVVPGGRAVATVRMGAAITTASARGAYVQATLEGWIAAALLGASRDSFTLSVKPGGGVRLRATANPQAPIVAELRGGMGLNEVERQGPWVHVRRSGWLKSADVASATVVSASTSSASATKAATATPAAMNAAPQIAPDTSRNGFVLTPIAATSLTASPAGERIGSLGIGARAMVTARERGWVRVRVEGWAREADLSVADTALRGALSAADLRADPDAVAGRLVHWEVEVLAHQVGDPLRKGLADQEPYLLAQGPAGENALLYLAIPPALASTAREIPDLGRAIITARVRVGKSEPVGIPVLELLTIVGR